jgi:hypothetical protein
LNAVSIIGDILFFVPVVGQVSVAVKGGISISRAVLRGTMANESRGVGAPRGYLIVHLALIP